MICIRLVVSHDDNDADEVATVVEITSATIVVSDVELVVLSFDVIIHQVIAIASVVAFSEFDSLNDVISIVHSRTQIVNGPEKRSFSEFKFETHSFRRQNTN